MKTSTSKATNAGPARRVRALLLVAAILPSSLASAAEAPLAGSPFFFQTSGAATALTVGDWYTASGGGNGYHYYTINLPCPGNTTLPIHVDIFSPELHGAPGATLDEIRDAAAAATTNVADASNTRFEIYAAGTAVSLPPTYNLPAPGGAGSLQQTTYTPVTTNDAWVRFYTLPTGSACGAYVLRAETVGATANDDNSWKLRVSGDDDGNPATTPPTNLDPGITLAQIYGSMQHNGAGTQCISTYELLGAGPATFNNFDMDGGTSVTYNPPRNGGPIAGTLSANGLWNVGTGSGPPPRDGDLVTVAVNQTGYWRIDTCLPANNQFVQEGGTPFPGLFSLPLSMTLTKTDGVTTAQMGGYLQYTLTFTNTSVPTSGVAKNVTIVDTIPTNSTFDSALVSSPFTGTCSFALGAVTCAINENVAAGASGTVIVNVLVDNPAAGSTVVNNASLDFTDVLDAHFPLITASDTDQLPALRLVKTSDCTTAVSTPGVCDTVQGPQVGDVITYTVTLSNPSAARQTGLVITDPLPAGTSYVAQSTVATGFEQQTFRDDFNAVAYNNDNGTQLFAPNNWSETGEATDPNANDIRILNDTGALRLRVKGVGKSVQRAANLTGYAKAYLTYDSRRASLEAGETMLVRASTTGGLPASYTTVATITGTGADDPAFLSQAEIDISAFISATTFIQFAPGAVSDNNDTVFFDTVQILAIRPRVKDNIPAGVNLDLASGVPSTLVTAADGFVLDPGQSMTVRFRTTVTAAGAITNTATATSTQDTDPAQGSVRDVALTRASLAGLRVSGGRVEFATTGQRGTAGFNLYSADSPRRRADKIRINAAFVPSPRPESLTPILYGVEAQVAGPYLWIEEVELGSDTGRMMGPFSIDDERLLRHFERLELRLSGQPSEERGESRSVRPPRKVRAHTLRSPRRGSVRPASTGVKIEIAEAGLIQVAWNDLTAQGMPPRFTRDPGRLQLTAAGARVPFTPSQAGLSFVALDLAADYTAENVYVITWNGAPVMAAPLTQSEPPVAPGYERVQKNWIYYQAAPRGTDPWLWDVLAAGDAWPASYDPTQGDFDLPGYAAPGGDVPVRIALLGRSQSDHHVEATINGVFVGSVDFSGMQTAFLEGSIAASSLTPSGNHLALTYTSPDSGGYVYLNYADLGLTLPAPTGAIDRISPFDATVPRLNRADYLIVTHGDFEAQANRIAALKNTGGRSAVVVDVERAYDRFTAGIPDASAVKALIAEARRASTVLLIGDDTIDPADNYNQGERVFVPSALGFDPYTGRVVSENLYADRNDDGAPDLSIGRLSVRTAAEADAMVHKIENQEFLLSQNLGRHVVAVDNQGINDMQFRAAGRTIERMLAEPTTFADVALGSAQARDALVSGLNAGALTTTWVGHGAPDHWADEWIFGSDDAAGFANTNQATLLLIWACLSSDYRYFYGPSVSEAMVLTPMGGAVASFGPTGLSLPTLQRELYLRLYPRLLAGLPVGEAVRQAKTEMLAAFPGEREFLHGWVLLGDPDVRLPR